MLKTNIKLYLVLSLFIIITFFLTVFFPFGKKSSPPSPSPTAFLPSPTSIPIIPSQLQLTPVSTIAPTFTGVKEEELSKEETDLSTQKQELREKVPWQLPYFTLTFDFVEDKFVVVLAEPKNTSKKIFDQWLKNHYPAIPEDRFIFR